MVVISSSLENIYLENILKISAFVMKKISISFKCFNLALKCTLYLRPCFYLEKAKAILLGYDHWRPICAIFATAME